MSSGSLTQLSHTFDDQRSVERTTALSFGLIGDFSLAASSATVITALRYHPGRVVAMAHISRGRNSVELADLVRKRGVDVNDKQMRIRSGSPAILWSHVYNFLLLSRRYKLESDDRFVFVSGSTLYFRACDVFRYPLSMVYGQMADTTNDTFRTTFRRSDQRAHYDSQDDSFVHVHGPTRDFVRMLKESSTSTLLRSYPLSLMPHEGSYYPVWLMFEFIQALRKDPIFGTLSFKCPFRDFYGTCMLEEILLPSYLMQRYAAFLLVAGPPLVTRYWGDANQSSLSHLLSRAAAGTQFCGIRFPGRYKESRLVEMGLTLKKS